MRYPVLFTFFLPLISVAQQTGLPHVMAPHEVRLIDDYRNSRGGGERGITAPPTFPVRTMAEWEEVQTLVVTWTSYPTILKQIVRYAVDEVQVIIVCDNANDVEDYLLGPDAGGAIADLSNVVYMVEDYNSVWMRDYGMETMYRNEVDTVLLMDWIYNRPRPDDDVLPDAIATYKNIRIYTSSQAPYDLVHTGGNFMADGFGTAFSSMLVDDENGANGQFNQTVRTPAGVDDMMEQWMGIPQGRYIKMETLPYDGIHHIDMHMKLLDEETLLVGEFPTGQSDGPQLELNLAAIQANYTSVFGTPYEIIRIPMPPSTGGSFPPNASYRTYANNIFINKTVLVPTYREQYDTTGLRILREALPGYRVIGIDCDNATDNIISASGALHCITKCIGVEDPLLIRHQRLRDTYETVVPYTVTGYIRHRSDISSAEVFWTTDTTQAYASLPMTDIGNDEWTANIPAQPAGTEVFYYIHATANSGKQQVRPIVAPEGYWNFHVLTIGSGVAEAAGPTLGDPFPMPATNWICIPVGVQHGTVEVSIVDALGRNIMAVHHGQVPSGGRLYADVSRLDAGSYWIVAEGNGQRRVKPMVKN
ncbi:MAG: agmatine deiminase family protein [Flavobacteriales bacterium]